RATHVWLPNFAFNHLRLTVPSSKRYDLSSLKALINCSEPCKAATFDAFLDRFHVDGVRRGMLTTSYAMAEAVFAVTQSSIGRPVPRLRVERGPLQTQNRLVPVEGSDGVTLLSTGKILPGIKSAVLDSERRPVGDGM